MRKIIARIQTMMAQKATPVAQPAPTAFTTIVSDLSASSPPIPAATTQGVTTMTTENDLIPLLTVAISASAAVVAALSATDPKVRDLQAAVSGLQTANAALLVQVADLQAQIAAGPTTVLSQALVDAATAAQAKALEAQASAESLAALFVPAAPATPAV